MKLIIIFTVAAVAALLPAQQTQLGSCVAFNDELGGVPMPLYLCNTTASVGSVAPTAFTVTEIEVFGSGSSALCATLSVNGATVNGCVAMPPPPAIATNKWWTIRVPPIAVPAGGSWNLSLTPAIAPFPLGGINPMTLHSNSAGTSPLLLTRSCASFGGCLFGTMPCNQPPAMTNLVFRLRGPACTGGTPATVMPSGTGCGSPAPVLTSGFATVGDPSFYVTLPSGTAAGVQVFLFFAGGFATAGMPVAPGNPCQTYLDPVSFQLLASLGYEPFEVITTPVAFVPLNFLVPLPAIPELVGLHLTFQAAILDPVGGVPVPGLLGVGLRISNALSLTIGS